MLSARTLLERLSRKVVLKRKLPAEFNGGALYVSPSAALRYWRYNLWKVDPTLLRVALHFVRPGHVVWDIGANVGLFSFAAANLVGPSGKVLAIEADTWLVGLLRRSSMMKTNVHLAVDVLPVAVSDSIGVAEFHIAKRGRASNFLAESGGLTQAGGVRETQLVPTVTLDWLLERYAAPDFLKIDVEGVEDKVLRSASGLLSKAKPSILCEVASVHAREVGEYLSRYGYVFYDAEAIQKPPVPLCSPPYNTLAVPKERLVS
jgi:FkbM family methyltransferase